MTQCTIVTGTTLAVHSPYNRDFAYHARMVGGTWDPNSKTWKMPRGYTAESLAQTCRKFYPGIEVVITDAIPVPVAIPDHGHVGTVGASIRVTVEVIRVRDFTGQYGATRLHEMRDADGHVFTWFASTARYAPGVTLTLDGKVKKHDNYKSVSQTVLTRCKKIG